MVTFLLNAMDIIDVGWIAYVIVGLELFLVLLKLLKVFVKEDSKFGRFLVVLIPALYEALDDIGGKKDGSITKQDSHGKSEHSEPESEHSEAKPDNNRE